MTTFPRGLEGQLLNFHNERVMMGIGVWPTRWGCVNTGLFCRAANQRRRYSNHSGTMHHQVI